MTAWTLGAVWLGAVVVGFAAVVAACAMVERKVFGLHTAALAGAAGTNLAMSGLPGAFAVEVFEAYMVPWVLFVGVAGFVHSRWNPAALSRATVAPALWMALGPLLPVAVVTDGWWRLALVTALSVGALVAGVTWRLKSPVVAGAFGVVVIALTQGGVLVTLMPGWVILGLGAAVLLGVGVRWEHAVTRGRRGRRAQAWYSTLH